MKTLTVKISLIIIGLIAISASFRSSKPSETNQATQQLTPEEKLGKQLFFDTELSSPKGVSCASCHNPNNAFSDHTKTPFSIGATHKFGNRNTPTLCYTSYSPNFYFDSTEQHYVGGYFWDGRATTLENQVAGPLFNHAEMNLQNKTALLQNIKKGAYVNEFISLFGNAILNDTNLAFECFTKAIASFERSKEFNVFTSKYDYYIEGLATLNEQEQLGLEIFTNPKKGNCAACHPTEAEGKSGKILFTDFTYDNLGLPAFTKTTKPDWGLGKTTKQKSEYGKFKVPTLRNIALTAPYMHNGIFTTLEEVVSFYNHRDSGKFGKPEINQNVNREELGNLKLTTIEEQALVAFMLTLTDGYKPNPEMVKN